MTDKKNKKNRRDKEIEVLFPSNAPKIDESVDDADLDGTDDIVEKDNIDEPVDDDLDEDELELDDLDLEDLEDEDVEKDNIDVDILGDEVEKKPEKPLPLFCRPASDRSPDPTATSSQLPIRNNNNFCGFPSWLKWFIPLAATILAGLIIWSALNRPQAVIDPAQITEAVDNSGLAGIIGDATSNVRTDMVALGQKIDRLGDNIGGTIAEVQTSIVDVNTTVNQLVAIVGAQDTKIDKLQSSVDKGNETLDKIASQLLADGNSLLWSTGQFGWSKTKLDKDNEAAFIKDILPQIKAATDANPTMIVRVVGRVDRSSTKTANDGQVKVGTGRATYIAKILQANGVKVAKKTWAYSYSPNRRVVDVYVEPPK